MRSHGILVATCSLLALCTGIGCGGDGGDSPGGGGGTGISAQPLTGKIGGQPFTFAGGETDAFLSMGDRYFVTLYGTAFNACAFAGAPAGSNSVIFEVPKVAGTYKLGLSQTATLYDASVSYNRVATRGSIAIESVSDTTITGGASITFDADNTVNGTFTATICAE